MAEFLLSWVMRFIPELKSFKHGENPLLCIMLFSSITFLRIKLLHVPLYLGINWSSITVLPCNCYVESKSSL